MQYSRRRQKVIRGIFSVKPRFNRVALLLRLRVRQFPALRNLNLQPDQVQPGHHLRDRMLHLNPRIDLNEIEIAGRRQQKFHRAGIGITDLARQRYCRICHAALDFRRDRRRRALFNDLLMPPLDRAIALIKMHHVAVMIAKNLHFNVARAFNIFLHQQMRRRQRRVPLLLLAAAKASLNSAALRTMRMPRPPPPSEALISLGNSFSAGAGTTGTPASCASLRASLFDPSALITSGARPNENNARIFTGGSKRGILRQKSISRMDRISARQLRRSNDLFNIEI